MEREKEVGDVHPVSGVEVKDALLDSCRDEGGHGGDSSSGMELSVSSEKSSSDSSGEDEEDETMNVAELKRLSSVLVPSDMASSDSSGE